MTVNEVLKVARSQIGYKEGKNNNNKFGQAYGWNNVAWCCIFVWWVFTQVGYAIYKTASCTALYNWFKSKGMEVSKHSLRAGDIVFFDFSGGKDCDHVGIVESVGASRIITIEGNTSSGNSGSQSNGDGVYRRYRSLGVISHAVRPPYTGATSTTTGGTVEVKIPQIQVGSKGKAVYIWQSFLKQKGYNVGTVDSDFGSKTKNATVAWQKANGLSADGIVGQKSWSKAFGV